MRTEDVPIATDTGCSLSVTPFRNDFVGELEPSNEKEMVGLKDSVEIQGAGWIEWYIRDIFNDVCRVRTRAYLMPSARVRLFSSQTCFQENRAGSLLQTYDEIELRTSADETLTFPCHYDSNLPMMMTTSAPPEAGLSQAQALTHAKSDVMETVTSMLDETNHNVSKLGRLRSLFS